MIFFKDHKFDIKMETTGERLSGLEDRSIEVMQAEEQRKNVGK